MRTQDSSPSGHPAARLAVGAVAVALLGGVACGAGTPDQAPPVAACAGAADCADDNACTVEACTAGECGGSYTAGTAAVLLGAGLAGADRATFALATTSGSVIPRTTHTFCPDGADPATDPPTCVGELDLPAVTGATFTPAAGGAGGTLVAVVPTRFANLVTQVFQTSGTIGGGSIAVAGNGACAGGVQTHAGLPVQVTFTVGEDGALDATAAVDAVALANATVECLTGGVAGQVRLQLEAAGRDLIRARLQASLERALELQLCATPPCPAGLVEVDGLCRLGAAASAPCRARPRDPRTGLLEPAACVP